MAKKTAGKKRPTPKRYVPKGKHETTRQIVLPGPDDLNQPSSDLHDYTILLTGAKAIGKTSASASFPGNLNFQWEPMRANIELRMLGAKQGIILRTAQEIMDGKEDPWELFKQYLAVAVEDKSVNTISIDTVDIAYNACFESVCARLGVHHPTEVKDDYGNTWKMIQHEFTAVLNTIKGFQKGLLLISHTKEREVETRQTREGGEALSLITASCAPACINILKSVCDFWFCYMWHDEKRRLWLRDQEGFVDVACGTGFIDGETPLTYIDMPEGSPDSFYSILNAAFHGNKPTTSSTPKKKAKRKTKRR